MGIFHKTKEKYSIIYSIINIKQEKYNMLKNNN